mgnify:FL=1|jgi:hypothetical protein|tara:strand:+ start:196 stop:405 length:210 start_codon:yes stop_codon:yes gene_type:complete
MKYNDYDNARKDCKAICDIIARQSDTLLIECIAESIAIASSKFDLSYEETMEVFNSKAELLKAELLERI